MKARSSITKPILRKNKGLKFWLIKLKSVGLNIKSLLNIFNDWAISEDLKRFQESITVKKVINRLIYLPKENLDR